MHPTRSICTVLLCCFLAGAIAWTVPSLWADDAAENDNGEPPVLDAEKADEQTEQDDGAPQRVILRVNRNETISGYVQLDDDDVIVIRTQRGVVRSFPKIRVMQIIRLVDPEPEQRGVVYLRNGQTREGVIIEDTFDYVLVEIEGIPARLRREFVDHVVLEPTFEQRYQEYRATIRPHMYDRHMALCRWLVRHRRYELAKENLEELLSREELHEARELLKLVDAQLALRPTVAAEPEPIIEPDDMPLQPQREPAALLSHEDVNLMRVYEVDFDNPPRINIRPETVRRFFQSYGTHESVPASQSDRNAMIRGDATRILRLMFELRARELYPDVEVTSEPYSMNQFRLRVHNTWLLNNCATSGCHGGPEGGDLYLHRRNHTDARVRYTNFMILEKLEVDPDWPLVNYENPEMSLIIQYGLPRNTARLPHPDVPGWQPVFARANDRMKQGAVHWIRSMMQPRPDYPIDFDPMPRWKDVPVESEQAASSDEPAS